MSNVTTLNSRVPGASAYSDQNIALIRRTVAKDCNADEFEMFISMAMALRLDPLRKQIYAFVFSKNDPKKRRMSIITGIDGFRTIADRTGNYRPDDDEPVYELDESAKGPLNPVGIVKAVVKVFKHSHGDWHRVTAPAYWSEYAPIKDEFAENEQGKWRPTGKQNLDTTGNWGKMPRLMLAKVAEALALRKAWPDDFSNVHGQEEMDRAIALEGTATEVADRAEEENRRALIGANGKTITVSFDPNDPLESVPLGRVYDRVMAYVAANAEEPSTIAMWQSRNRIALREYWSHSPGDALQLKRELEKSMSPAGTDATGEPQ